MTNSDYYKGWLDKHAICGLPIPDGDGYFRKRDQVLMLPFIKAYWVRRRPKSDERTSGEQGRPGWESKTWRSLEGGWVRYLRADQTLDLIASYFSPKENESRFTAAVGRALTGGKLRSGWFLPLDKPLLHWPELIDRRVEALRIDEFIDGEGNTETLRWARLADWFPLVMRHGAGKGMLEQFWRLTKSITEVDEALRRDGHPNTKEALQRRMSGMLEAQAELIKRFEKLLLGAGIAVSDKKPEEVAKLLENHIRSGNIAMHTDGIDLIHTPENVRAGLSGYLCKGWQISDAGIPESGESKSRWGPSAEQIPYRLSNAPRRLMLGAALTAKAVPLEPIEPRDAKPASGGHQPFGCNLRAAFSTADGYTHEDAFVISESAARKLARPAVEEYELRLLVPSIVSRVECASPGPVSAGAQLVRAYIDLFALGWRRHELDRLPETPEAPSEGWLQIAIPGARVAGAGVRVLEVSRTPLNRKLSCEEIVFRLQQDYGGLRLVGIGDKLATRHGIKGVVAQIRPDDAMPGNAEILLSSEGVLRRQAMGQFREAAGGEWPSELPATGTIFVLRQPQDASDALSVYGRQQSENRGQRYGWMEFTALLAHGATAIPNELLSVSRSTASWMRWESECRDLDERLAGYYSSGPASTVDHRQLARQALNRYLSLVGVQVEEGRLTFTQQVCCPGDGYSVALYERIPAAEVLENLSVPEWWKRHRGRVFLNLEKEPLEVTLNNLKQDLGDPSMEMDDPDASTVKLGLRAFPLLPPWLRPDGEVERHPLTKLYRRLLTECQNADRWKKNGPRLIRQALYLSFDSKKGGAGAFVTRDVLGRRLTRSARAVIVPDPTLRLDEIRLPKSIAETLFEGLAPAQRTRVLVHRNPLLHRRGLLALKPVIDNSDNPVFGMPLGILSVMGADFDGDTVCVVALETAEALEEAKLMSPGSQPDLRRDPFRQDSCPAFPLLHELLSGASARSGEDLASKTLEELTEDNWLKKFSEMVCERLRALKEAADGWPQEQRTMDALDALDLKEVRKGGTARRRDLYQGRFDSNEEEWFEWARAEMMKVYDTVRAKGRLGGVLKQQLYRLPYREFAEFRRGVEALQVVTERLTQSALDVKTGTGVSTFSVASFFRDPAKDDGAALLSLDSTLDEKSISNALAVLENPTGILLWLQQPSLRTLAKMMADGSLREYQGTDDPRVNWYL